ncbi:MAG: hypothetical protein ACJA0X_003348 [Cyclobacteriaceae bacterium]|jgi:hypothetical protein
MTNSISKASIIEGTNGFQLFVDGKPFRINGAGLEFASIPQLAEHGANSFRTWRIDNGDQTGREVLDEAHKYGLKVMMGIEVARERHGFDYNDEQAVKNQLESIRKAVLSLKDHPALIIWGIGNELNLHGKNPRVWDAVNDISKMIHEVDPHHLTTTSLAGMDKENVAEIKVRATDLDALSVQLYGELIRLPELLKEVAWNGPLIVSEWGATGYWEVKKTKWNAPIEDHSSKKADAFLHRYNAAIAPLNHQCIGSFVFLWGQKQERTPTWFGMFNPDGQKTEVVDVMHYIWNGQWPEERCQRIEDITIDNKVSKSSVKLQPRTNYKAEVKVIDPKAGLTYQWFVLLESDSDASGGDYEEVPEEVTGLISSDANEKISFKTPDKAGAYRLFVYVHENRNYSAHANFPFYVEKIPGA